MPPARKSTRSTSRRSSASSRRSAAFKEPAAVKQLNRSLDAAQKAITQLSKQAGRDAGATTRSLHGDLRKFLTNARRDTGKLTTALKRDFEQAQKTLASAQSPRSGRRTTSSRRSTASGRRSGTRSGTRRSSSRKTS
jgi:hypothetical protein